MKFANFVSSLLDLAPRDASGNIVLQGATAEQRLNVEELAIFSTIDLIASAASLCEWRTYQAGERKKGEDWYSFNVEPNQNQNAAEFKRLLVARLLRFNEALVFERGGALYLADSFTRTEYAFRPCVYTGVTCNNLTLSYTLTEPDVFYFRLANQDAAALLANLRGLYSEAMKEALDKYKKSGGRSGILEISGQARGKKTFETDLDKLMNERFKTFFENKNAVLPLGYSSTGYNGTYGLAMTQDGQIVADYITTGTLSANLLRAGVLQDKTGKVFKLDLDAGTLDANFTSLQVSGKTPEQIAAEQAKEAAAAAEKAAKEAAAADLKEYQAAVEKTVQDLQGQIDGNITTWFYPYAPTAENKPASDWTTETEREAHAGDLFYNTDQASGKPC